MVKGFCHRSRVFGAASSPLPSENASQKKPDIHAFTAWQAATISLVNEI